jgi:hypothetical protein
MLMHVNDHQPFATQTVGRAVLLRAVLDENGARRDPGSNGALPTERRTAVSALPVDEAIEMADIEDLDLSMITMKLMDAEEGEGWSAERCAVVAAEYRRFLALTRLYADRSIVPSKIVDQFWHAHILDTQAYATDCERLFGFFLHHFPYFGMRGPDDARALGGAYDETLALYQQHFGPAPADLWARTGASRCPNCGERCRPKSE